MIASNFMEVEKQEDCFYMHLSFGVKKKNTKKISLVSEPISEELLRQFLSNLDTVYEGTEICKFGRNLPASF